MEEINPKTGGHDIPYQRERIMDVCNSLGAARLIVDCTGIGGAIEQDLRVASINSTPQIHFLPFVFTGGPRGTKTQVYRDYVSFIQQGVVKVPHPKNLPVHQQRLMNKWFREHIDLQYTMDAANKTEKIAAPTGKHDDYCDSSVMALHATLTMLPGAASVGGGKTSSGRVMRDLTSGRGGYTKSTLFTTKQRQVRLNKGFRL